MKKILLLTLAILLLTGCRGQSLSKETTQLSNDQEDKIVLNDNTNEKKVKQENIPKPTKESNNKKDEVVKEDNKTSQEKKKTNQKTTNKEKTKLENNNKVTEKKKTKDDSSKKKTTDQKKDNEKKKQETETQNKPHQHMFTVNGGWYKTNNEAIRKFQSLTDQWNKKYEDGKISWDEFCQRCPSGYEIFRCTCGMYGLNLTYN